MVACCLPLVCCHVDDNDLQTKSALSSRVEQDVERFILYTGSSVGEILPTLLKTRPSRMGTITKHRQSGTSTPHQKIRLIPKYIWYIMYKDGRGLCEEIKPFY